MAVTWNPSDKDAAWGLSGSDKIATMTGSGAWKTVRATLGVPATHVGGVYFEVVCTTAWVNLMLGMSNLAAGLGASYNAGSSAHLYSVTSAYVGTGPVYTAGAVAFGTINDRIGIFLKNGLLFYRKNGTWLNSGAPAVNAGPVFHSMINTMYPTAVGFANSGSIVTLCANRTDITGSIPTGGAPLDSTFSLTTTLVDSAGAPLASTAVKWAVFNTADPSTLALIDKVGSGTTNGSGVITIAYDTTSIPVGGTCGVLFSTTSGTADANCRSHYLARAPTIT